MAIAGNSCFSLFQDWSNDGALDVALEGLTGSPNSVLIGAASGGFMALSGLNIGVGPVAMAAVDGACCG